MKETTKDYPNKFYYASDQLFHAYKACSSKEEAEQYIITRGQFGYVETYELKVDHYYLTDVKKIGPVKQQSGVVFGVDLEDQRIHKFIAGFLMLGLNIRKSSL
jgi:hypothetical protein